MSKDTEKTDTPPKWDNRLLVGHPDIDHEHKSLFAITSRLFVNDQVGISNIVVGSVLCELADYVQTHFINEEHLMAQAKYPMAAEHVVAHCKFIKEITILIDHYERGRTGMLRELQEFLFGWLITHISEEDMKFGEFWKARLPDTSTRGS